jgi:hypothetical protein
MVVYVVEQAGLFTALGYGEPGEEELLKREQGSVVLYTPDDHEMAVIEFIPPGHSPDEGLERLEQRYVAEPQPDVGVLCNGKELWVYRRAETGLSPHPILHLNLKDVAVDEMKKVYEWLRRRKRELKAKPSKDAPVSKLLVSLVIALLLAITIGWILVRRGGLPLRMLFTVTPTRSTPQHAISGDGLSSPVTPTPTLTQPSAQAAATPTFTLRPTSSPTPSSTPSPLPTPSSMPTSTPSPTSTPLPYLAVSESETDVYNGPGEGYGVLGTVRQGDRLRIWGCSEDGTWYQVDYLGWPGWVAAQHVTANITCQNLPVIETPPPPINHPPTIQEIQTASTTIEVWDSMSITCQASDPDQDVLTYDWEASGGSIGGEGDSVVYYAPGDPGTQAITVTVRDGHGGEAERLIPVEVVLAHPPPGMSEPVGVFGQAWREGRLRWTLGWATSGENTVDAAQQLFEKGVMFWREDNLDIYVLLYDGNWEVRKDNWGGGERVLLPRRRFTEHDGDTKAGLWRLVVQSVGGTQRRHWLGHKNRGGLRCPLAKFRAWPDVAGYGRTSLRSTQRWLLASLPSSVKTEGLRGSVVIRTHYYYTPNLPPGTL